MMDVADSTTRPASSMDVDSIPSVSSQDLIADKHYTDGDHRRMDEEVAQKLGLVLGGVKWHLNPSILELAAVLDSVVAGDDRLDPKHRQLGNVCLLFRKHVWLASAVAGAWRTGSYRDIRELVILQPPVAVVSVPLSETQLKALRDGFSATYRGLAVDAFYKYLQKNDEAFRAAKDPVYYAKFCSIVQSSGTGKTRLMLQLATKGVCVLYMNIKSPNDAQGWPPRDDVPADLLRASSTEGKYGIQCYAFFSAIFKVLRTFLEKGLDWYGTMCNIGSPTRTAFFVDLKREYAKVEKEMTSSSEGSTVMNKYYREMVKCKGFPRAKNNEPRVVIALDEAHVLHEQGDSTFHRAPVFLRTIKEYSDNHTNAVWVVFASTTSKVVHFASPQDLYPSARVNLKGEQLFSPFTRLGWDQNSPTIGDVRPDEVAQAKHIIRYGRPLWVLQSAGDSLQNFFSLAAQKLCGSKEFIPHDHRQAFAVLAQRFGLDIAFGSRNALLNVEISVASHLRLCLKTTEDRMWSYTTYLSEPILSCAAASMLHAGGLSPSGDNLEHAFESLEVMVNDGVVDKGQIGELVSRFIWLLAKDFFVRTKLDPPVAPIDQDSGFEQLLQDCQMIPVVEYLEFVFGPKIWEAAPQAKKEFQNAYINFSHWASMKFLIKQPTQVEQVPIDKLTLSQWERTSALQCCHLQPVVDKVIPMYFKPLKDGDRAGMSQIFISDKARVSSQDRYLPKILRGHQNIAPGFRGLPYIAVLVDLGLEKSKFVASVDPASEDRDMSLRIYARGLDATTYPFLEGRAGLTRILQDLYKRQYPPPPSTDFEDILADQMDCSASSEPRHLNMHEGDTEK